MVDKYFCKEEEGTIPGKCDMGEKAWVTCQIDDYTHFLTQLHRKHTHLFNLLCPDYRPSCLLEGTEKLVETAMCMILKYFKVSCAS